MRPTTIPKLSELKTAPRAELLALWTATLGSPPQFRASRELLASTLAWQLQKRKFGDIKPAASRKLGAIASAENGKKPARLLPRHATNFHPGTAIVKRWRGAEHMVTVLANGFQYRGKVYASLSQLAREITGTRWNGPAFFGLRRRHRPVAEVHDDRN